MKSCDLHSTAGALRFLRSSTAIRERCQQVLTLVQGDRSPWFKLSLDAMQDVVTAVEQETLSAYPTLNVPYHSRWRHFGVGGVEREAEINQLLCDFSSTERSRSKLELAIVSVLLDAGAGTTWAYFDRRTGASYGRSEGLAVASLDAFARGVFGDAPCTVTAAKLCALTPLQLAEVMQVSDRNALVGIEGRCALLNRLGGVILSRPGQFQGAPERLGGMLEPVASLASAGGIEAGSLLSFVLDTFSDIWPGRIALHGHNLGDVWAHQQVQGEGLTNGLVPFHKLSQWLTYSLLEPLAEADIAVVSLDQLTGLAEYRNGGLFIDGGVVQLRDPRVANERHQPSSELIIEWRALTIALLDMLALALRNKLGLSEDELPLAKVLQGGTWSVGRKFAAERRLNASPPLTIESDGTVF